MSAKGKLRVISGGYAAYCPACQEYHAIYKPWKFNENFDRPTFSPSLLVRGYSEKLGQEFICHAFIANGKWQYLPDCSHELRGQTIALRSEESHSST